MIYDGDYTYVEFADRLYLQFYGTNERKILIFRVEKRPMGDGQWFCVGTFKATKEHRNPGEPNNIRFSLGKDGGKTKQTK